MGGREAAKKQIQEDQARRDARARTGKNDAISEHGPREQAAVLQPLQHGPQPGRFYEPEQRARQLWREYYETTVEEGDLLLEHFPDIDWVGPVPGVTPDPGPERAIPWAEIQADEIARREGADAG